MKKSAVEWLIDKLFQLDNLTTNQLEILEQAKKMEKQQQDEFAIGFAEWLANSYYSYNFGIKMFEHRNKEIYKTTNDLLEAYKKQKGL